MRGSRKLCFVYLLRRWKYYAGAVGNVTCMFTFEGLRKVTCHRPPPHMHATPTAIAACAAVQTSAIAPTARSVCEESSKRACAILQRRQYAVRPSDFNFTNNTARLHAAPRARLRVGTSWQASATGGCEVDTRSGR